MKRHISSIGLLSVSVSAILGSGWLFGAFYAARDAGPASILAWILGGVLVCIIAFTFGEVCALIPISGSSVRIPNFTHGKVVGIFFSMIIWISYVALMVVEVQAVVQYTSYFYKGLVYQEGGLSFSGYIFAMILMFIVAVLNNFSIKWLINCNTFLTIIKIVIPVGISCVLLYYFFSIPNIIHPAHTEFAPYGFEGVLVAISSGGVIFSFNAFKQAAELAGEAKKPHFSVPFAIVGSILICVFIFLLLQSGFLSALEFSNLDHGWAHIILSDNNSPFASILKQSKILWLLPILFIGAMISPFAAALMYCTGGARSLFGIAANGCAPKIFLLMNKRSIPFYSIWVNFILGMIIFLFFKGWDEIATLLTCLFAISYAAAPICMLALRYQVPNRKRPLKLPFGLFWAYIAFYICTLLIYWTGWRTIMSVDFFLLVCLAIVIIFHFTQKIKGIEDKLNWKASLWMFPYFIGISVFSYIGNFGGGLGLLAPIVMLILIAVFCIVISISAVKFRVNDKEAEALIDEALDFNNSDD